MIALYPTTTSSAASTALQLTRYVAPLAPDAICDDARDAFARDAGLFAIPVVEETGRPLGLINRFKFLELLSSRFGRELVAKKPVSAVMNSDPLIVDDVASIDEIGARLLDDQHQYIFDGFIVTSDGRYAGVGTGFDVMQALTERRHSGLEHSERRLRIAGRMAHIGGWELAVPWDRVDWTDEVCAIHDLPAGTTPTVWEALNYAAPEWRDALAAAFSSCASDGAPFDQELEIITDKGRRVWVRVIGEAVRNEASVVIQMRGALQDISERKALEQQLLRAQRLESLGTMAGGIAHDLNNVLTPITLAVELLQETSLEAGDDSLLDTIRVSAKRGAAMVSQVLSFARGFEGRRVTVDAEQLIDEVVKITRDTFDKQISIRTEPASALRRVVGDPTQLHQVLLNLCVNARDAMPAGGVLTITAQNIDLDAHYSAMHRASEPGPYLMIGVADTGTGIPAAILDKIFDPFFTTKGVGHGTGLGLATSLTIVKSHGGFIRVESHVGQGTRFWIYLPAQTGRELAPMKERLAPRRGNGELVLVVDDEAAIRAVTKQTLEQLGYSVLLAEDGATAVALYAQQHREIRLVLTDMMMPFMDGAATIQVLSRMNPDVRIIAASGIPAHLERLEGTSPSVRHVLPKPFTADVLANAVSAALA